MKRGPYYKAVSAVGQPIRTARRGPSGDGDIAEGLVVLGVLTAMAYAAFFLIAVITAPIWVPFLVAKAMFDAWHPAVATTCLILAVAALAACREAHYRWKKKQDPDPDGLMREAIRQEKLREQRDTI